MDENEEYRRRYHRSYRRAFWSGGFSAALNAFNAYWFIDLAPVLASVFTIISFLCLRSSVRLAREYHRLRRACEERGIEFPPP